MDEKTIQRAIEGLKQVQLRSGMYFVDELPAAANFLHGFNWACVLFGLVENVYSEAQERAVIERGWKWSSLAPLVEMAERGLSQEQITEELLSIEIDKWNILLQNLSSNK